MAEIQNDQDFDPSHRKDRKRQQLRVLVKIMVCLGFCAVLYVAVLAGISNNRDASSVPSLRVSIDQVKPGEALQLLWHGRPVIIIHRSQDQLEALESQVVALFDANSEYSQQPENARNAHRSLEPRWFIAIAAGTDLGCSLQYKNEPIAVADTEIFGALQDSCAGSYYDLAGRVLDDQAANRNLVIPDYFRQGSEIILGAVAPQ